MTQSRRASLRSSKRNRGATLDELVTTGWLPTRLAFWAARPAHLPRHFLLFIVAYRLQADMHGDLDRVRALARLAKAGVGTVGTTPQAPLDRAPCSSASGRVLHRVTTRDQCFVPGTGPPTAACLRWPAPSRAPAGTDPASSVYARRRHEGRSKKAAALRHLHPRLNQVWAGAALQLPGCAARAAEAYIKSQTHEGGALIQTAYMMGAFQADRWAALPCSASCPKCRRGQLMWSWLTRLTAAALPSRLRQARRAI